MRGWKIGAVAAVFSAVVLVLSLALPSSSRGQADATATPGTGVLETLQTQVSELQTQVAALQTQVAGPQPKATASAERATAAETELCGRPYRSWGGGTADDIKVTLLQLQSTPDETASDKQTVSIEVVIDNRSDSPLDYGHKDFEIEDCGGNTYAAGTDGPEQPVVADGEVAPGDSLRGYISFTLPASAQPARFTYHIQRPTTTGAQVTCPLVNRDAPPAPANEASGGAGCSARGGSG
jgi:Domain of unknown function (DUF4352)